MHVTHAASAKPMRIARPASRSMPIGNAKWVPANSGGIPRAAARDCYKLVHRDDVPAIA
jgi:hypothetical protein